MKDPQTRTDEAIIEGLEFAHYGCERSVVEGGDSDMMAMYNRRRAAFQEEAERRGILNEADLEAAAERAQAAGVSR